MNYFLVIYSGRTCIEVESYATSAAASTELYAILDRVIAGDSSGISATVYSTTENDPGVQVGDVRPEDLSDEMDFKGLGDD